MQRAAVASGAGSARRRHWARPDVLNASADWRFAPISAGPGQCDGSRKRTLRRRGVFSDRAFATAPAIASGWTRSAEKTASVAFRRLRHFHKCDSLGQDKPVRPTRPKACWPLFPVRPRESRDPSHSRRQPTARRTRRTPEDRVHATTIPAAPQLPNVTQPSTL